MDGGTARKGERRVAPAGKGPLCEWRSSYGGNVMARRGRESGADAFFHFLTVVPWWVGPVCAALVYVGLRFVVPAFLGGASDPNDMVISTFSAVATPTIRMLGTLGAVGVLVIWGAAEFKKFLDRQRLDKQSGIDSVRRLTWSEFEELAAEAYRRKGYAVERTGGAGDGGVDVILRRDGQTTMVQCKRWRAWTVGVKVVRELRGVMASEGAERGIVVSCGEFSSEAAAFAEDNGIDVVSGDDLVALIRSVQRRPGAPIAASAATDRPISGRAGGAGGASGGAPACPECGTTMVRRIAKRGAHAGSPFWGCPRYPACHGKRPG